MIRINIFLFNVRERKLIIIKEIKRGVMGFEFWFLIVEMFKSVLLVKIVFILIVMI